MSNLEVSSDNTFLQLPESLTTSPSQSTFMAEEDASICPLLPNTSSPQLDFNHPLTPSTGNDINSDAPDDPIELDDSSSSSSGIGMGIGGIAGIGNVSAYHHLRKNGDVIKQENGKHGKINYDYLNALNVPITKDIPSFVSWNWPMIRKITFYLFLSGIIAMLSVVAAMIYQLPKTCNPETPWYQGSAFYEIFPASFKDSNSNGIGDLRGLASQVSYFQNLSIGAVRLNSIFASKQYPESFREIETLMEISKDLGTVNDLEFLISVLHEKNISLILDLPLYPVYQPLITEVSDELADEILKVVDLVDVFLDVSNGTQKIEKQVLEVLNGKLKPSENGPWIHWSINGVDRIGRVSSGISPDASLAATLMEIMLPGTPSIFYGDEISMALSHDPKNEHKESKHMHHLPTMSFRNDGSFTGPLSLPWLPKSASVSYQHLKYVIDAITLRKTTPSIYKNSVSKDGNEAHGNTHIRASKNDLVIIERIYPRRNTFVSITNLGPDDLTVDISALFYSGELVLGSAKHSKVFFNNFKIRSLETVIVKLDK
ncbi:CLUMA_CG013853, isoform A [Clunio marinus]|uniref:CLUMA_CG013853, isoform A n=1 Tax=Clunio marinus TaxID=568069 RepID=A0A1J1IQ13_9DIPT|nr:CLUMA_CG013853, isoform A [Clunio marinus]